MAETRQPAVSPRRALRPRLRWRPVVAGVLIGLAIAVAVDVARVGGPVIWLARAGLWLPLPGAGQQVALPDGRHLTIDCRGSGSPTVVLEAGAGDGIRGWGPVHDAIAATTRTCAYDRAGRGASEGRGVHTLRDAAADLRGLLSAAGETGPFVIAGHSLGGCFARIFAADHRAETVGLVLVDSFDPDLETAYVHPLLGDLRAEYEERLDGLRALVAGLESLDWAASEKQLIASDLTGIPIEVLSAPRAEPRLDTATNTTIAAAAQAGYESLSPGSVRYELAWGAGHVIQADRPDLVIASVVRLVEAARASSG